MHQTLHRTRPSHLETQGSRRRVARGLRAIFGSAIVASILAAAVGCDKRAQGEALAEPMRLQTSLAGKPTVLFLLFGDPDDPRLLPVATIGHGHVTAITLDADGWRKFDELYFKPGAQVAIYQDGAAIGNAVVRRGMWDGSAPLYKLPGCRALRPLAAARLELVPAVTTTLELLGTSDPVPPAAMHPAVTTADLDSARDVAARVGQRAGLTSSARNELQLTVHALYTGVSSRPTLAATYMEKGSGSGSHPRHVFALSDSTASGYAPTFLHAPKDSVPEFRRLIDHLDLTGDGVDEIVLEGWKSDGDSFPIIMKYINGEWHEIARGAKNWCADPPRR